MSSEMDFDDFINDIELMGCHAIDESFEFEENGVVPPDAKMPTLEDEPRTSWFNSDNNSSSSRKRENSSPLPDAKRQRTDDENSRELTDQDLEELFGSLGDALESCQDEIPAADCLTNSSSTDDDNGRELTEQDLDDLYRSLGDALESCEDEIPAADCLTNSSSTDDDNGRELTEQDLDDLYRSLGDALESCEDEIPAADCLTNSSSTDDDNGRQLTEQDLDDLYRSLGDALESRSPREDVQIRRRPKNPRFTIKMPVNEAAGTVKRLVGSNGAPSIFYLTEFNGDSVAEQPALPPSPPPHPVMRLKLKAVGSKENIRPSTTPAQKHRKIVMKESQSKKLKCQRSFLRSFLLRDDDISLSLFNSGAL